MIEEVVASIKNAEEQADTMIKDALQEGKKLVFDAEAQKEKDRKETALECKAEFSVAFAVAEKDAENTRATILEDSKRQSEKLREDKKEEINALSEKLVKDLLNRYVK